MAPAAAHLAALVAHFKTSSARRKNRGKGQPRLWILLSCGEFGAERAGDLYNDETRSVSYPTAGLECRSEPGAQLCWAASEAGLQAESAQDALTANQDVRRSQKSSDRKASPAFAQQRVMGCRVRKLRVVGIPKNQLFQCLQDLPCPFRVTFLVFY
jgi:hypothetical protein